MGEQSASRLGGDDYQHLYSWYLILPLLDSGSPYEYATVEHPEAGAADDVTLHAYADAGVPTQYHQVKWHVDFRDHYTFESLVASSKGKCLLEKLYDAWVRLRDDGPLELWLVSNWAPAARPDLGSYIREPSMALADEFFAKAPPSPAAAARTRWMSELSVDADEFERFVRVLRFELSYAPSAKLKNILDDRMARYGLSTGPDAHAKILHEIRRRIKLGGEAKRFTTETILEIVEERRLSVDHEAAPAVCFWLHAWDRQSYAVPATVELDWTAHFDRAERRVPSAEIWEETLLPELQRVRDELRERKDGRFIDIRARAPLTMMMALGANFPHVGGFSFRVEQPTAGKTYLWHTDASPSQNRFSVVSTEGDRGADVVIGLAVSGGAISDIRKFCEANGFPTYVYCEPSSGAGSVTVASENDLTALAASAKEIIRSTRERFSPERLHLIYLGPLSLALAIGQHLNAVGMILTYERAIHGGYQPSVILRTG